MIKKLREYFIGNFLRSTDDVFEKARALMLYRFSMGFFIIFMLPLTTDILLGFFQGTILHLIDSISILYFIFLLRSMKSLDRMINLFFFLCYTSSMFAFMIFNPEHIDKIGVTWSFTFVTLSTLMQRGYARLFCVCLIAWIPLLYVYTNMQLHGALTISFLRQAGAENPPIFLIFIPVALSIFAVWSHTGTIQVAKETITKQKEIIEEKNKDITDSIIYAQRIQQSLLPTEKYIAKNMERLKKNGSTTSS